MVSCKGLYADVVDDSLRETVQANDDSFERKVIEGTIVFFSLGYVCLPLHRTPNTEQEYV